MSLADKRKVRTKKWSTIYCEKTAKDVSPEGNVEIADTEDIGDFFKSVWARTVVAKKLTKKIKDKIRNKSHSCKKSLLNLQYPEPTTEWERHWGSQLMCDICEAPAIYESIVCRTCDTIVHIPCVDNNPTAHTIIRHDETEDEAAFLEYNCAYCQEFEKEELQYYHQELRRLKKERKMRKLVARIVSSMRTHIARLRFKKQRRLAITMQSVLRRHIIRTKFNQLRRNQIRVLLLDILNLPKIDNCCMVVWTVVDKFKNYQLFRMDKEYGKALLEGFLIPGCSSNVSLYLSVIRSEGQNMIIAAQAQLALRDVDPFEENQVHTLTMSENIQWMPQETRVERTVFHLPHAARPASAAGIAPRPTTPDIPVQNRTCQIRYNALSTVTSLCANMHGPPLDVLRRVADQYVMHNGRSKGTGVPERKTKWWVCLVELNMLFYQYCGDTKPRHAVSIIEASTYITKESPSGNSIVISFPDRRKWSFDFDTVIEAKRFVFAVTESKKALEGNSIYFKHAKQFNAKFTIH